jgi:hypothetical protein
MVETYPILKEFYEDKRMIDALKNLRLEIGSDARNRFWLNPFGTKTGRNNPSTNRCILGLPHTMRSFIKPSLGMALAQVDYGAEEVGIAAALSCDPVLKADYLSGDPYRQFAAASLGILNPTEQQRQVYKATVLGQIYGLGTASLARNLGISKFHAERIINQVHARYPILDAWLKRVTTKAAHIVPIVCTLGWSLTASGRPGEERTFLIEDTIDRIEQSVAEMQEIMRRSSRDLLGGFELRADCKPQDIVHYPDRFVDKRERESGMRHWNRLMALIEERVDEQSADHGQGSADAAATCRRQEGKEQAAFQAAMGKTARAVG